jgi:hypothetical protein
MAMYWTLRHFDGATFRAPVSRSVLGEEEAIESQK